MKNKQVTTFVVFAGYAQPSAVLKHIMTIVLVTIDTY